MHTFDEGVASDVLNDPESTVENKHFVVNVDDLIANCRESRDLTEIRNIISAARNLLGDSVELIPCSRLSLRSRKGGGYPEVS